MFGPLLQPVRGLVFALVLYPLRQVFFGRSGGWLLLWWTLVGLGILDTYGPAPGSIEAMLYTIIPIPQQLLGYLEVVPQAGLFAFLLAYWVNHPEKRAVSRTLTVLFAIAILLPAPGAAGAAARRLVPELHGSACQRPVPGLPTAIARGRLGT